MEVKIDESNLRNEIKSYIVRQGMTMQEVVDLLHDEHGWSDSVSNLSNKLQRESLRYVEAVQLACTGVRDRLAAKEKLTIREYPESPTGTKGALLYSPDGSMCVLRSLSPGQLRVRAVLRHFVPYKGVPPLRCLCSYPSALRSGNNLLTQTISTAKSEQLFH